MGRGVFTCHLPHCLTRLTCLTWPKRERSAKNGRMPVTRGAVETRSAAHSILIDEREGIVSERDRARRAPQEEAPSRKLKADEA